MRNIKTFEQHSTKNTYKIGDITICDDEIQEGDFIIDTEKTGVIVNGEKLGVVVKCKKILDEDLIWVSIDGKSSACDSIEIFKKVINF